MGLQVGKQILTKGMLTTNETERCANVVAHSAMNHGFVHVACPASPSDFVLLATKAKAAVAFGVSPAATAELILLTKERSSVRPKERPSNAVLIETPILQS